MPAATSKLVVIGLGNYPYPQTRHSIGQIILSSLVKYTHSLHNNSLPPNLTLNSSKQAWTANVKIKANNHQKRTQISSPFEILFVKPRALMNISGPAILKSIPPNTPPHRIITIQDDLDLVPSKLQARLNGSAKGHNGVRSLEKTIGKNFWRIRIGIGRPGGTRGSGVADWVLEPLGRDELHACEWSQGESGGETALKVWEEIVKIAAASDEMDSKAAASYHLGA